MVGCIPENVIGWDLGGAHLKAVSISQDSQIQNVFQTPCPLWQGLDQLEKAVEQIQGSMPQKKTTVNAITMTGELVDLFNSRQDGVFQLLEALKRFFLEKTVFVFIGERRLIPIGKVTRSDYPKIASANWLASGLWLAGKLEEGLFIDVGSTTTDILPIHAHEVRYRGYSDADRLAFEELIYAGIIRTPVMALVSQAPILGRREKPMAELFATTSDVYRLTGELQESDDQYPSADGGEKSSEASARRLARQFGRDYEALDQTAWVRLAYALRSQQIGEIASSIALQESLGGLSEKTPLVGGGIGRFLVKALASFQNRPYIDYTSFFPVGSGRHEHTVSDCAPAAAVAGLLLDQFKT